MALRPLPPDAELDAAPPGFKPLPPDAQLDSPAPRQISAAERAATIPMAIMENMYAGMQGTSPILRDASGNLNYRPLGEIVESDTGLAIKGQGAPDFDPKTMVVLRDPQSGKAMAYARSPQTDESPLAGLGRLLSTGMITGAVTRLPGGVGPGQNAARMASRVADMEGAGVTPRLAAATQSPFLSSIQNILSRLPVSEKIIGRSAQTNIDEMAARAGQVADMAGSADTGYRAGQVVQKGLTGESGFVSRFSKRGAELFDDVGRNIDQTKAFDTPETIAALQALTTKFPSNPELGKTLTPATFQKLSAAMESGGGQLTWPEIKELRTFVGRNLDGAPLGDVPQGEWKALYGALSRDLESIASQSGPNAKLAFDRANRYWAAGRDRIDNTLKSVIGAETPEAAYAEIIRSAQGKGASADLRQIRALKQSLSNDEWGEVSSALIRQMGAPRPGAAQVGEGVQFSPATFVTEYSKLGDAAKEALMPSKNLRDALDQLARVAGYQKNVEKLANSSNSATQLMNYGAVAGAATEPVTTLLALAGTSGSSALMQNASFVRWLASAQKFQGKEELVTHLAGLRPIAQMAPAELRPLIQSFAEQVRGALGGGDGAPRTQSQSQGAPR